MARDGVDKPVFRGGVGGLGVLLGLAWVLTGCGSDDGARAGDEAASGGDLAFTVEGRGGSNATSGVMLVWEDDPAVQFTLRGVDGADNLVLFYITFNGVESVAGEHSYEIGLPDSAAVSGAGIMDDQVYYSLRGELSLTMSGDQRAQGRFDMELAFDDGSGVAPEAASGAVETALSLSGAFNSEWTVDCRSRLVGFTGGHYTHDSLFCQNLTF